MNLSSLLVAEAISAMGREEVLEAKIVLAGAIESYSCNKKSCHFSQISTPTETMSLCWFITQVSETRDHYTWDKVKRSRLSLCRVPPSIKLFSMSDHKMGILDSKD